MSPPGYQATVVKASRCGNEGQERSGKRKVGKEGSGKNLAPDGEARIFLLLLCRGVIRTHVSRVAPDWDLSDGQPTEQQRRAED